MFFGFFTLPSSRPTLLLDIPPAQGPTNPAVNQLLMFKKPHLGISGCLFCDLSSLFTRCWSVHRSHFALVPSNFASGHPSRFQSTRPCASPLWDRTIAFFGPLILIVFVSLFSLLFALFPPLSFSLLSSLFSLLSLLSSLFTRCCCCWLQDAVAVAELFAARSLLSILCALPSSLLGADPFLYHPALLEPNRCLLRPRDRGLSYACSSFALPSALFPLFV